ncbi:RNA degradosome polyphosphate kinase [Actinomyces gerencseriae]|uniref:RNA degradosome polyphosphate kinase n=1 Tax=Actinomyces gerencseriae TaxID=52769 RepID=UPI0023F2A1BE|nr:RNA degradosome polyphosphate kinase [Actinomyces gerencseriae]
MTTPDSSETAQQTDQPSRALLSTFLGGWTRFQAKGGEARSEDGESSDPAVDAGAPDVGAGPDGEAQSPSSASDDAVDAVGGGASDAGDADARGDAAGGDADAGASETAASPEGEVVAGGGASAGGDDLAEADHPGPAGDSAGADDPGPADDLAEADDLADLDDADELDDADGLDDHVIETADPRDFADDAGPQYEDEDFDEVVEEDPGLPGAGRAGVGVDQTIPEPASAASRAGAAETADGGEPSRTDRAGRVDPPSPSSPEEPDPEDGLPPLESFADRYTDRELTWMDFNRRVLEQAEDRDLPLLERAWFLAIFSSNLDEFYMVRVAGLMRRIKAGITPVRASGLDANQVLAQVTARAKELTARQAALFQEDIRPALAERNVSILGWDELEPHQQERLTRYFRHHIYPVLTPLAVDPSHPFPYISGLSLNLAVILRNPRSGKEHFARVKVPDSLPRLVTVPGRELGATDKAAGSAVIPLEVVIGQHLDHLFPGMDILEHHLFRVTRNEDLEVEEDDAENLLKAMEKELERRRFGDCVRLEVENTISPFARRYLVRALDLSPDDVFELPAPLDLTCLNQIHDLNIPDLKYPRFVPVTAAGLASYESSRAPNVFAAMRDHDVLLHHPYDSFSTSVQEFVSQAAADPKVLAIKQTLYRTSGDSPIVDALIEAAEEGKQVVAIVEIKARFDEENNISWARKLERAGVHVVYGMVGLKTHCKLLLVVRQESDGLRRYCHVGTGNYHPKTARGYEDLGLLTCDRDVAQDMTTLFNMLSGYAPRARFRRLLVAPRTVRDGLIERIEREIANKRAGRPAWIRLKVNSIIDEACIDALYRAGRAGVPVDIVVRGICGIRAGVPGLSDNIRVRSILGRYLEHSRVYAFCNDGDTDLFIGSADLMHRNLDRRVEELVRIADPAMVNELEWLVTHAASDAVSSWWLEPDGTWVRHVYGPDGERLEDIQTTLMARARSRVKGRH